VTLPAPAPIGQEVTSAIRERLDRVEAMPVGRGALDLGAYVRGAGGTGVAGGFLDYERRLSPSTALFGESVLGYGWGATPGLQYQAMAGLRMRW